MCDNEPRKEGECDMSKDKKFSASQIRELASEGLTVQAMAEKLNVDFEELFFFYADCSAKDRSAYPIRLLVTKSWLEDKIKKVEYYLEHCENEIPRKIEIANNYLRLKPQQEQILKDIKELYIKNVFNK